MLQLHFKPTIIIVLFTLFYVNVQAQKAYLTCTEVEHWPKKGLITIPETHNRLNSYLFLVNKDKYLELFNAVNYNKKLAKKAGLDKNDELQYLYLGVNFAVPNKKDSISVPLFLFDVKNSESRKEFQKYDGKLLNNINANDLNADISAQFTVKSLVNRESNKFWKGLLNITTSVASSASTILLGNPFGAADLVTSLQGHLTTGLEQLGNLGNNDNTIEHNYSFLLKLYDYEDSYENREIITSVRLYKVHWSFDKSRPETDFFKKIKDGDNPKTEDFRKSIRNRTFPLIMVVETRFSSPINNEIPSFTGDYQKKITDEYLNYARSEQDMFKAFEKNYSMANDVAVNTKTYSENINRYSESLKASMLVEIMEEYYRFKINVQEEHDKNFYTPAQTIDDNRYVAIANRYKELDLLLEESFKADEYDETLSKAYGLVNALVASGVANDDLTKQELYHQITSLRYFDAVTENVVNGYENNKSYRKYQEVLKSYERSLFDTLIHDPKPPAEIPFYKKLMVDYPKCKECVIQSQAYIDAIEKERAEQHRIAMEKQKAEEEERQRKEEIKRLQEQTELLEQKARLEELKKQEALRKLKELQEKEESNPDLDPKPEAVKDTTKVEH